MIVSKGRYLAVMKDFGGSEQKILYVRTRRGLSLPDDVDVDGSELN